EAGLCLYGHDLDETITPVEADLSWTVARKYRNGSEPAGFPGAEIILEQLRQGPGRIRRGFRPEGKIPVREGTMILDSNGAKAGIITSGGYGATIGGPVAMGYVSNTPENNTEYRVEIRKHQHRLLSVELPFVKHRYYSRKTG
ncbi:MAG: glycine cleavage T C-terminal barrel domain-containing protein, partial [Gammaproteobacteria bacterium]